MIVLRTKNFNILGGSLKDLTSRGGILKNKYIGGDGLKKEAWTVCRFKGEGSLVRKRGGVFQWGVDTPMHNMNFPYKFW